MGCELKIVLASTSPRRRELMSELGLNFIVVEPVQEEASTQPDPSVRVIQNAEGKVKSISDRFPDSVIIGADTLVYVDNRFLGKPDNSTHAREMLHLLSGRVHRVFTGVAVLDTRTGKLYSGFEESAVWFKKLSDQNIDDYVASGEPLDKAGAYAVQGQGSAFIEKLQGSWSNVVGLPLELLKKLLNKASIKYNK